MGLFLNPLNLWSFVTAVTGGQLKTFLGEREEGRQGGRREGKRLNSRLNQLKEMISGVCYSPPASAAVGGKKSFRSQYLLRGCLSHGAMICTALLQIIFSLHFKTGILISQKGKIILVENKIQKSQTLTAEVSFCPLQILST